MKDNYEIIKLNNEPYDFLVIAKTYENPLNYIQDIGKELHINKTKLLFDLTLINGIGKNRYIRCEYEADNRQLPACYVVDDIDESIKKISQSYFAANDTVVKESVIPNSLKFLLKSGMV